MPTTAELKTHPNAIHSLKEPGQEAVQVAVLVLLTFTCCPIDSVFPYRFGYPGRPLEAGASSPPLFVALGPYC